MFGPGVGVAADPATGSAAVALAVFWWTGACCRQWRVDLHLAQGAEIGRPSRLEVAVEAHDGRAVRTSVAAASVACPPARSSFPAGVADATSSRVTPEYPRSTSVG